MRVPDEPERVVAPAAAAPPGRRAVLGVIAVAVLVLLSLVTLGLTGGGWLTWAVVGGSGVLLGAALVALGVSLRREPPPAPPAHPRPPSVPPLSEAGAAAVRVVEGLEDTPLLLLDPAGRVSWWNAAAARLHDPGRIRGPSLALVFGEEEVAAGVPELTLARARTAGRARHEGWRPRAEGPPYWGEVALHRLGPADAPSGFAVLVQDTSERRRSSEESARHQALVEQNRRVEDANRLKSEFLHNVTHELRAPLNAVVGFAELLADGRLGALSPLQKETIDDIHQSSTHLLHLINDILDLAKIEAGRMDFSPQRFVVADVLEEVRGVLREVAARREVTVRLEPDPAVPEVRLDPVRFKQVLYNYLSNALKFTKVGSRVVVRTVGQGEMWFRLEVEDEGPGIAAGDVGRLFVEFQQIDGERARRASGTGLGLALARRIAEAQAGRVGARPAPGGGAVFFAVFPRRPRLTTGQLPVFPARGAALAGAQVLVVEPDPDLAAPIQRLLLDWGLEPRLAESGEAALEQARASAPDGVIVPLLLPDMTGLDALRALGAELGGRPFWAVVTSEDPDTRLGASHGALPVVPRPVSAPHLAAALERLGVTLNPSGIWPRPEANA